MMKGFIKKGDDILSHITAVPSALAGLTSLFGLNFILFFLKKYIKQKTPASASILLVIYNELQNYNPVHTGLLSSLFISFTKIELLTELLIF